MAGYGSRYGKMNLDDFLDLMEGQIRANASDRNVDNLPAATVAFMLEAFRMFDNDKDGYLNLEELKKACSLIGDESAAEALMEDADHNKDHKPTLTNGSKCLKTSTFKCFPKSPSPR